MVCTRTGLRNWIATAVRAIWLTALLTRRNIGTDLHPKDVGRPVTADGGHLTVVPNCAAIDFDRAARSLATRRFLLTFTPARHNLLKNSLAVSFAKSFRKSLGISCLIVHGGTSTWNAT